MDNRLKNMEEMLTNQNKMIEMLLKGEKLVAGPELSMEDREPTEESIIEETEEEWDINNRKQTQQESFEGYSSVWNNQ
jgi:hypothetical protein